MLVTGSNILTLVCIFVNFQWSSQQYVYQTKYINVPIDHFNFINNDTFQLRYLYNDTYWNTDGPIFFYTGNEGNIETFAQNTGFMWEIASEFQALLIFAEHRYYGKSLPFGNESFSEPPYLGYLSSNQALADYVYLIDFLVKNNPYHTKGFRNPVIAFGGSYGGMLSSWIRMKYPASVLGAIASSAPIWQFEGLTPCGVFNRILTTVFKTSSNQDCSEVIKKSWSFIRNITSTTNGKSWITSNWKLCKPLQTNSDIQLLIDWLTNVYGFLAMLNYPYSTDFIQPLPAEPVKAFCKKLKNTSLVPKPLLVKLGDALSVYTNFTKNVKCIDINQSAVANIGIEAWDFQACTDMIMPMCSNDNDMFENQVWNFTKYSQACRQRWNISAVRPDLAILEYGGKDLKTASNIIFSNGLLDPWSGGGVLKNVSKTVLAVIMPEAAHHLDLRSANPDDPQSVTITRQFHRRTIRNWLREYYIENQNSYLP